MCSVNLKLWEEKNNNNKKAVSKWTVLTLFSSVNSEFTEAVPGKGEKSLDRSCESVWNEKRMEKRQATPG